MANRRDNAHALHGPHFQNLPSLEDVQHLITVAFQDDVNFETLACEISECSHVDEYITRAANAVSLGTLYEIRSLRHALAILGLDRIRDILSALKDDVSRSLERQRAVVR